MSSQKPGRSSVNVARSSSTDSYHRLRVRNQPCDPAAKSSIAPTALAITSRSCHHESTPIISSCGLKMNMNGRINVRLLYQNAVAPVRMGSAREIAAAANEARPTGGVTSAMSPK